MVGKLIVRVYRAEQLASADLNGSSDPFIKMNLVNQFHRTSTQYKTLNPEWNEMFHFDVKDINNQLDILVFDEDFAGEDFLGRIVIPLLSIKNKKMVWYQLKDKKLQNNAKGKLLLRMDIEWSIVNACLRTFNPLEELNDPPPPTLRKSLMVSNFIRAKTQVMIIVNLLQYIKSCFAWEDKFRSLKAFLLFFVITWHFEIWMLPFSLFLLLCFNLALIKSPRMRQIFNFDEAKFSTLTDIRYIMASDDSIEDLSQHVKKDSNNNQNQKQEENKTIVERIQAGKDVVILIQDITGTIASYLERVSNTFTFKVPFLSNLMIFCLMVATIILYLIPLRYLVLAWGINKFTKKLRNPNAIDNNEIVDFLSRVPDNVQCIKAQNLISY